MLSICAIHFVCWRSYVENDILCWNIVLFVFIWWIFPEKKRHIFFDEKTSHVLAQLNMIEITLSKVHELNSILFVDSFSLDMRGTHKLTEFNIFVLYQSFILWNRAYISTCFKIRIHIQVVYVKSDHATVVYVLDIYFDSLI